MKTKEELDAEEAQYAKSQADQLEAFELGYRNLRSEWRVKGAGKENVDWAIVRTGVEALGCVVLTKPDFVTAKRYHSTPNVTEEDAISLVYPSVAHPSKEAVKAGFQSYPGLAWKFAAVVLSLSGAGGDPLAGKY